MTYLGRSSSVGLATGYGLDGPGVESPVGRDFPHPSRPALGPTQPLMQGGTRSFLGPGHGLIYPPSSSSEIEERVELYLYSPSGPSWPVLVWTLPYLYAWFIWPRCLLLVMCNERKCVGKDIKEGVFDVAIFQIVTVVSYIHFLSAKDVKLPILA